MYLGVTHVLFKQKNNKNCVGELGFSNLEKIITCKKDLANRVSDIADDFPSSSSSMDSLFFIR